MDAPLSDTSYHHAEEVGSFHYVKKGAESEQPVGTLFFIYLFFFFYQWMGCRDHAGITCFPHLRSWQAFYNMGPLTEDVK